MSRLNQYGHSFKMDPKLLNYKPVDISESRREKRLAKEKNSNIKFSRTMEKVPLRYTSEPITKGESKNLVFSLITILGLLYFFNYVQP